MKKWISLLCIAALMIALLPGYTLPAKAVETSGKCGDNLTWEVQNGTLTISGTGPMYNYPDMQTAPWYELRDSIWHLDIQEGVTTIGDYAFSYLILVTTRFRIPTSIEAIGSKAFARVSGNLCFFGEAPEFADDALDEYHGRRVYTLLDWDEEDKQGYGSSTMWVKMDLELLVDQCQRLIPVNTPLKPENLSFQIGFGSQGEDTYVPKQVTFSEYDNSTCGEKKVTITADTHTFELIYYVTDGTSHLDLINVEFPPLPVYNGRNRKIVPIVTIGTQKTTDYTLIYNDLPDVGITGSVTIQGTGVCEGFSKTFYYPILKVDLSQATVTGHAASFTGLPVTPSLSISTLPLLRAPLIGVDYAVTNENNINVGTATARVVGINNMYGHQDATYDISSWSSNIVLTGKYIGQVGEELSDDILVEELIIPPAEIDASNNCTTLHVASYALYRLDEDKSTLIYENTTDWNYSHYTRLQYDFSDVYNRAKDKGGEVYALSYSWVNMKNEVYAGIVYLIIPAKVPDATSMTMYKVENDGDFRFDYFGVEGDDGVLGDITWTSSDASVASVEDGIVSLNKPGTAVISAQWGNLKQSQTVTVELLDLTQGIIFDYSEESGARVIWDSRLLEEGTDYILNVEKNGESVTVTATGCGLFTGELMKEFVDLDSLADPHTHGFDNSCDSTCNGCDFTRDRGHTFSTEWSKDLEIHYHECTACGEKTDVDEHTLTENGKECTVCGRLWTPGDIDGNGTVNRDDVIALLLHVSMPAAFPISIPADYNGDGQVTRDDVIQLLLHVSMPDAFPLQ